MFNATTEVKRVRSNIVSPQNIRPLSPNKGDKKTKVIGGHAMVVRDFTRIKRHYGGKYAKLNNHAITAKEFGK